MTSFQSEITSHIADDMDRADALEQAYVNQILEPDDQEITLSKYGIKTERKIHYIKDFNGHQLFDERGNPKFVVERKVLSPPPAWYNKGLSLLNDNGPCFFEGCEEIKAAFDAEKKRLMKGKKTCSACEVAPLIRKYLDRIYDKLSVSERNQLPMQTTPPAIVVNHETHEEHFVARQEAPGKKVLGNVPEDLMERLNKIREKKKLILNTQAHGTTTTIPAGTLPIPGPDGSGPAGDQGQGEEL